MTLICATRGRGMCVCVYIKNYICLYLLEVWGVGVATLSSPTNFVTANVASSAILISLNAELSSSPKSRRCIQRAWHIPLLKLQFETASRRTKFYTLADKFVRIRFVNLTQKLSSAGAVIAG